MEKMYCFCGALHFGETTWDDLGPSCWPVGEREAKKAYGDLIEIPIIIREENGELYLYMDISENEVFFFHESDIGKFFGPLGPGKYTMELEFWDEDLESEYSSPYFAKLRFVKTCCDECTYGNLTPILTRNSGGSLPLYISSFRVSSLKEGWYKIIIKRR